MELGIQNGGENMIKLSDSEKKTLLLGVGIGIGTGVVAVATAPVWLPAAKARALQMAAVKGGKALLVAAATA